MSVDQSRHLKADFKQVRICVLLLDNIEMSVHDFYIHGLPH